MLVSALAVLGTGCARDDSDAPAAFEPARAEVRTDDRVARCSTMHSLRVSPDVLRRYGIAPGSDKAIITCSLQTNGAVPVNIPARISGVATTLVGTRTQLSFTEILDSQAVSYVAPFDLTARSEIRFEISMIGATTGARYTLELRQTELSGRK